MVVDIVGTATGGGPRIKSSSGWLKSGARADVETADGGTTLAGRLWPGPAGAVCLWNLTKVHRHFL